jgi:hypothetical protein
LPLVRHAADRMQWFRRDCYWYLDDYQPYRSGPYGAVKCPLDVLTGKGPLRGSGFFRYPFFMPVLLSLEPFAARLRIRTYDLDKPLS